MIKLNPAYALALALLIASLLPGCATYQKCGRQGCPGDAEITAQVEALFGQHVELQIPDPIGVQTVDHVVYLTGLVDTDLERSTAESLAQQVPGVVRVVNSIGVRNFR
jgi:osmotically-inducible protein OsmY